METTFYLNISIQTADGPRAIGCFDLGTDPREAKALFQSLKGSRDGDSKGMLYMEFMEKRDQLPVNIDILLCDLQQLGTNCMIITQELFRLANMRS